MELLPDKHPTFTVALTKAFKAMNTMNYTQIKHFFRCHFEPFWTGVKLETTQFFWNFGNTLTLSIDFNFELK